MTWKAFVVSLTDVEIGSSNSPNCDADDKQSENLIAWSLPHTAERRPPQLLEWRVWSGGLGIFKTTITDPEPLRKQGQVLLGQEHEAPGSV